MPNIIHFIKYNNGFILLMGMIFLVTGSTFASETVSNAVIGQTTEEVEGVDNTALLALSVPSLSQEMRIISVNEDAEYYYVTYTFTTFDIVENVWQDTEKSGVLKIEKRALGGSVDLGLYVQKELQQLMESQRTYLADVQKKEKANGETKRKKTTKYSGLKGLVLDSETEELPGYRPVVKPFERKETPYTPPDVTRGEIVRDAEGVVTVTESGNTATETAEGNEATTTATTTSGGDTGGSSGTPITETGIPEENTPPAQPEEPAPAEEPPAGTPPDEAVSPEALPTESPEPPPPAETSPEESPAVETPPEPPPSNNPTP